MKISVRSGDIAAVKVDALVTAINSGGMWFGGIDRVIQRRSGQLFHRQALQRMPLEDGRAFLAEGPRNPSSFRDVVFVVDDLERPLREIVAAGLAEAHRGGSRSVSLPAIRMGIMRGVVEKSTEEAAREFVAGIRQFTADHGDDALDEVTVVVYQDETTLNAISAALAIS